MLSSIRIVALLDMSHTQDAVGPTGRYIRTVGSDCDCQNAAYSAQHGLLDAQNISLDG